MRPFIYNVLKFTGFAISGVLIFLLVAGIYFHRKHIPVTRMPPPMISDSYSYNDKLLFARNKHADIVTIGSSMSLNNMSSEEITRYFKSDSYLNLSSWGMTPKDVFYLMKAYVSIYKPGTFMINGSLEDLAQPDKKVDYTVLKQYLETRQTARYYLKYGNLVYYVKNIPLYSTAKTFRNIYASLVFDKYGAVPIDTSGFVKSNARWIYAPKITGDQVEYDYMDSVSSFCKTLNIRLIYFESPVRDGLMADKEVESAFRRHYSKVEEILGKNGQTFVRSSTRSWPDDLYVDGLHMHEAGAAIYTRFCLDNLRAQDSLHNP